MKSTLFASTLAAALTSTSFGQVEPQFETNAAPWQFNWDGTTLDFYQLRDCFGYTAWDFIVEEETTVTYQLEWFPCEGLPFVDHPGGFAGPFAPIISDWYDQGEPSTWSGTFTLDPGVYPFIYFYEFQGTLTFGRRELTPMVMGDDCDDGCPEDPFKRCLEDRQ